MDAGQAGIAVERRVIAGLGNPGSEYRRTRHNVGFLVVEHWVARHGGSFRREKRLQGEVAVVSYSPTCEVWVVKPQTFMNASGECVRDCLRALRLQASSLFVVHDEVELPYGTLKIKPEGGPGGHNGLRSIEKEIATRAYPRLRVGVGREVQDREAGDLADYVLSEFNVEEKERLPALLERAAGVLDAWLAGGVLAAVQQVNKETT